MKLRSWIWFAIPLLISLLVDACIHQDFELYMLYYTVYSFQKLGCFIFVLLGPAFYLYIHDICSCSLFSLTLMNTLQLIFQSPANDQFVLFFQVFFFCYYQQYCNKHSCVHMSCGMRVSFLGVYCAMWSSAAQHFST